MARGDATPLVGIVLAAGQSKRMGEANKLTTMWNGKPLVRHAVEAAHNSKLERVIVVTGHQSQQVKAVLPDGVETVHNPDFATGMAGSIVAGVRAAGKNRAIMILLGDMPMVDASAINLICEAWDQTPRGVVTAMTDGIPGNPVLFGPAWYDDLCRLQGDRGARAMIKNAGGGVGVEIG